VCNLNSLAVGFTIIRERTQLTKCTDLPATILFFSSGDAFRKASREEKKQKFFRWLEKWNAILNFEILFTNGRGKIMLGKVTSGYTEKKESVQVFRKERGREREREKGEGLGPHLTKGMISFTQLGVWEVGYLGGKYFSLLWKWRRT